MKRKFLRLSFIAVMAIFVVSCSDDNLINSTDDENNEYIELPQPTGDEITSCFSGKTLILGEEGVLINFFKKRLLNCASSLEEEGINLVVMTEQVALEFLTNKQEFAKLRSLWLANQGVGFIRPAENALKLHKKLRKPKYEQSEEITISEDLVNGFADISLWVVKADGNNASVPKVNREHFVEYVATYFSKDDENGSPETGTTTFDKEPTDYAWGKAAQAMIDWLNKNLTGEVYAHQAMVTRSEAKNNPPTSVTSWPNNKITISYKQAIYDAPSEPNNYPIPEPREISTSCSVIVTGAYNKDLGCDIYDVKVEYDFPTNQIFITRVKYGMPSSLINSHRAYWSGFCYIGPEITMSLKHNDSYLNNVSIHGPAPVLEGGSFTTTHDPGSVSVGGSIMFAGGTTSTNFSANYTLSKDYSATTHSDMPMNFYKTRDESNDVAARWKYYRAEYELFDFQWGQNPIRIDTNPTDLLKSYYSNTASVTMALENSRQYKDDDIILTLDLKHQLHSEAATPWDWAYLDYTIDDLTGKIIILPIVNRYFEKFTPDWYRSSVKNAATSDQWANLKETLMGNVNYKALCDETLVVGSRVETTSSGMSGVEASALEVWEEAITTLVHQNNGRKEVEGEWVIGLPDSEGNYLNMGLYIKGKEWKLVDNIADYDWVGQQ